MSNAFDSLSTLLDERWTCRQFLSQQVPRPVIEQLLALAQRAPSWCNTQPWHLEITSGDTTARLRSALLEHAATAPQEPDFSWPVGYPGVYGDRRRECGYQLYESVGIDRADTDARFVQMARNLEFFDAPHLALVTSPIDLGTWGAVDCGLWIQSFLLGAQALGLAAAPQAALAPYASFFREWFGLPGTQLVVCGISFGYADTSAPINNFRTTRAPADSAVTWHG